MYGDPSSSIEQTAVFDPLSDHEPVVERRRLERHDYWIRAGFAVAACGFLVALVGAVGLGAGSLRWEGLFSRIHRASLYILLLGFNTLAIGYRMRRNARQLTEPRPVSGTTGQAVLTAPAGRLPVRTDPDRAAGVDSTAQAGNAEKCTAGGTARRHRFLVPRIPQRFRFGRRWFEGFWMTGVIVLGVMFLTCYFVPLLHMVVDVKQGVRSAVYGQTAVGGILGVVLVTTFVSFWKGGRALKAFSTGMLVALAGMGTITFFVYHDMVVGFQELQGLPRLVIPVLYLFSSQNDFLFLVWLVFLSGWAGLVGSWTTRLGASRNRGFAQSLVFLGLVVGFPTVVVLFTLPNIPSERMSDWLLARIVLNESTGIQLARILLLLSVFFTGVSLAARMRWVRAFCCGMLAPLPFFLVGMAAASHLPTPWNPDSWHPLAGISAFALWTSRVSLITLAGQLFLFWLTLFGGYAGLAGAWVGGMPDRQDGAERKPRGSLIPTVELGEP